MADASNVQTDFRGGVWSPFAQGRMDDKDYHRALNVCLNGYPIEEGSWNRRQGTRFCGYSRGGVQAWLRAFHFSQTAPYVLEFTNGHLQIWQGTILVMTNDPQQVVSVSTANPAVVTTLGNHGWTTNDRVAFFLSQGVNAPNAGPALQRRFTITVLSATTFSLADELTGAPVVFGTSPFSANQASVGRVLDLASPYTTQQLPFINVVVSELLNVAPFDLLQGAAVLLHPLVAPQIVQLTNTPGGASFANFSLTAAALKDGPYFDPPNTGTVIASALSGSITISSAPAGTFVSTDVGRQMRLFSEPPLWAAGTAYVTGASIKFNGLYYVALSGSTGKQPDASPTIWALNPTGAQWAWGTITAVASGTQCTLSIDTTSAPLLYGGSSNPITTWRLGLYSVTTGFPTCGVWHEGRLWLGGAQPNRFDASMSNNPFVFSPTGSDGTVADNNGISYILNSDDVNQILWLTPDHQGLVFGTAGGEWLMQSGSQNEPLTPTNISAKRVTRYKAFNTPPVRAGLSLLFVHAQQQRLYEYSSDVFSGKFMGRVMNEKARHLATNGIAQVEWQSDLAPIAWTRQNDGSWAGMTYKREKQFTAEPPEFNGWHNHTLGSGRLVESIAVGPNPLGTLDALMMATNDPTTGIRHIELLTDMFDETTPLIFSWFLDDAVVPTQVITNETTVPGTVQFFGFNHLIGKTITAVAAGLDLGDYLVAADGSITVPLGATAPQNATTGVGLGLPLFTPAFINAFIGIPASPFTVQLSRTVTVTHASAVSQFIQTFHDTSIVTGTNIDKIYSLNDYNRNEFHTPVIGATGVGAGWIVYNRQTTALKRAFTQATIFGSTNYAPGSNSISGPYALDDSGFAYWFSGLGNNDILRKMNTQTGQIVASFGVSASSFNNDNNFITPGRSLTTIKVWQEAVAGLGTASKPAGFRNYLLSCPVVANTAITVMAVDDITYNATTVITLPDGDQYVVPDAVAANKMQWAGFASTITEAKARCVTGASYTNGKLSYGDIWVVGEPTVATAAYGFYRVRISANADLFDIPPGPSYAGAPNAGIAMVRTGGITPAQIDATWTNINNIGGVVFDRTDGNLIMWFQTNDAVTNKQYIVKINPGTPTVAPSVVWKTATTAATAAVGNIVGANSFYVGYGTVAWLSGTTMTSVTTAAGVLVTTTVAASSQLWNSYSDDRDAMILFSDGSQIWHNLINVNGFSSQTSITTDYNLPAMPALAGFTYTSQGQRLRPAASEESGARNGPAFGKTRRNHREAILLANSQGIYTGSQFVDQTAMRPVELKSDRVNINPVDQLYTGVTRVEVDDDYTFDGMLAWQITRPYPCTVCAVGGMLHTQDV